MANANRIKRCEIKILKNTQNTDIQFPGPRTIEFDICRFKPTVKITNS